MTIVASFEFSVAASRGLVVSEVNIARRFSGDMCDHLDSEGVSDGVAEAAAGLVTQDSESARPDSRHVWLGLDGTAEPGSTAIAGGAGQTRSRLAEVD